MTDDEQRIGPGDVGDLRDVLGKNDPLFSKPVVHQLSGRATPAPDQTRVACGTCADRGWIGGSVACPDCNTPPVCRCARTRPNSDWSHCLGCGQKLHPQLTALRDLEEWAKLKRTHDAMLETENEDDDRQPDDTEIGEEEDETDAREAGYA